jgi:hypothetical protein
MSSHSEDDPQEKPLYRKQYRYFGNGQAGLKNDSRSADIEAARAAGIFSSSPAQSSKAYQATPLPAGTPLASGGNTGLVSQVVNYQTGESKTTYAGLPALRIDVAIGPLTLGAGDDMANPIDVSKTGVLLGYTVAVNDPNMRITSIIYGDNNSSTTLWDDTVEAISYLGRGLTQGQAEAVSSGTIAYSLDIQGQKDEMWPWLQRYRSTPSKSAMQNNLQYSDYAGTKDDIWLVCAYTPAVKEGYSRVYLNITNNSANPRMILRLQISRIEFQPTTSTTYTSTTGD